MNFAQVCRDHKWGPGTRLVGDEGLGPTVIEITAVGEKAILAKVISHNGKPQNDRERAWILTKRCWKPVAVQGSAT